MIQTGDGATMALLDFLEKADINIIDAARRVLGHLENTTVTGVEDWSMGRASPASLQPQILDSAASDY